MLNEIVIKNKDFDSIYIEPGNGGKGGKPWIGRLSGNEGLNG